MSRVTIEKLNNLGFKYIIEYVSDHETCISLKGTDKSITVKYFSVWQIKEMWERWQTGAYIQDAFRVLSADEREFILSGITPSEWAEIFKEEDE